MTKLELMFWLLVCFLTGSLAHCEVYGEWGLGLNAGKSQIKYGEFGYESETPYIWDYRAGVGAFVDRTATPGVKDSLYCHLTAGIAPRIDPIRIGYYLGPALISSPDSQLGSNLQVVHKLIVGFKDFRGAAISLVYTHFSNAGATKINKGRDFMGLQLQIP